MIWEISSPVLICVGTFGKVLWNYGKSKKSERHETDMDGHIVVLRYHCLLGHLLLRCLWAHYRASWNSTKLRRDLWFRKRRRDLCSFEAAPRTENHSISIKLHCEH